MHSQDTPAEVVEAERRTVAGLLGLPDPAEVAFDDFGWDSRVYLVGRGEAVFKFPRSDQVRAGFEREIAALRLVAASCDAVDVPLVEWEHPELAYFGYRGIVGEALTADLDGFDATERTRIGTALGTFVRTLQGLELPSARVRTVEDEIEEYQRKYGVAREVVADACTAAECRVIDRFFHEVLPDGLRRLGERRVLAHGDLGGWNVVIDPTGRPGVIDFGDVSAIDESKDLTGIQEPVAFEAMLAAVGDHERLREKIALRVVAWPALDLPFFLGKGDDGGVRTALDLLRTSLLG